MMDSLAIQDRTVELCHPSRLPTMGAQAVSRFTVADHPVVAEVLDQLDGFVKGRHSFLLAAVDWL